MANLKIGVFGCGNMGRALVIAIKAQFPSVEFFLFTPSQVRAKELAQEIAGTFVKDLHEMPKDLNWYFLGFKPQSLIDFSFDFQESSKIVSVLAGVKTTKLFNKFQIKKIARLMPNTPSSIKEGANLLFFNSDFSESEQIELNSLLSSTGKIYRMNSEEDLDLTTAFSGSGPALIFEMARVFEAELTRMTNGRVPAKDIVTQTFFGSASLMNSEKNQNVSFEELRKQVTSKKGVTYEALEILEKNQLQEVFSQAFEAAYKRTLELSK